MSKIMLDDLRAAADAKYGHTEIDLGDESGPVRLLNALRLSKAQRDELFATQEKLEADDADQEAILKDCIRLVAQTESQADRLLAALGDDLAMLVTVFDNYSKATQVGEA